MPINIRPLIGGETNAAEVDYTLEFPAEFIPPEITSAEPISVRGVVTNQAGYMRLRIEATVRYTAECARCLSPVKITLTVPFERTVAVAGTLENDDVGEEYVLASDGLLDIDVALAEQIALELPSRHLCGEDCLGLCPICGKNLGSGACGCEKDDIDPRLAPLKKLLEP